MLYHTHILFTDTDKDFLQQFGGVEKNSFINIIESDPDENEDTDQPQIIRHSSYYDYENLIPTLCKSKNNFSILSTNIQSINAKIDQLRIFVDILKQHNYVFSAICIQESWLSENSDVSQIQLDGYNLILQGKSCSSKGGLIIYLNKKYDHDVKMKITEHDTWEGQVIQVKKGKYLSKAILLGNIYRPPKKLLIHYQEFMKEFTPILAKLELCNNEVIVAGDFNVDLLELNDKHIISEYFDMYTNHSFYPKITVPTRLSNKHGTLIDNFFCKLTNHTIDTTSGVLIPKLSDHQPYFLILDNVQTKQTSPTFVRINQQDKESINKFENELRLSNELSLLDGNPGNDPNVTYNVLHNVVQSAKAKHMPSKLIKFNKYKHKKTKWITTGIIKSIQFRDHLYKTHKMTNPDSEVFNIQKINLYTYNNILKKSIRLAKKQYYHTLFMKFKDDIKGTWKTINEILNKTRRKKCFPRFFKDGNTIITDQLLIANKLNSFFTNIGSNLSQKITAPKNKSFKDFLTKSHANKFKFQNVNETMIEKILDKLAPKTSFGFDGLSTKLIKIIKPVIIVPLIIIINQMLNTGIFPDKLKTAKIIPIYKKDDETLFTNYRPISLLPAISKIFEKVIFNQLYEFFVQQKLFYNAQYGFRTEHSTEYAALELVDRVMCEMDKNYTPINVYLDLSKAFDTLDHKILLDKLQYYGINGVAHRLLESYLSNRKQYVEINETKSESLTLTTGVPQGSILGPLLFIIYINDIAQASRLFDFIIYADDTTLSTTLEIVLNESQNVDVSIILNSELNAISDWLKLNKLSLNVKKSKYMIFHTTKRKKNDLELIIDNTKIERVHEFNFLGLMLNENLNWKNHINKISNKVSSTIGILNKLKHFLPLKTKVLLYNSLILSHLNFGILAWGYECVRIAKLQKKAVRIITLSKYNAHSEPILKKLKLLKVEDILRLQELKFYYKLKNNKLPHYLQSLPIKPNTDTHSHATRTRHDIHLNKTFHDYAKNCVRINLPKIVNNTPIEIIEKVETHSLHGFSVYIKKKIIETYVESCTTPNCFTCNQ